MDAFQGTGDTILRDQSATRTLDFSRTPLNGIAEVDAGPGHDTLVASNFHDGCYRGRTGTDTFAVKGAQGNAITISILDFNQADRDRIDLRSLSTTFGALLMWQDGPSGDARIRVSGTVTIRLVGFALTRLTRISHWRG